MKVRVIWRRTATCAAATTSRSCSAATRPARFTEPRENFRHQHQDVRVENGVQYGDLLEFCDSSTSPGWPG